MFKKLIHSFMTGEEWTEPTQQTNLDTKATLTDADDRAEKATVRQSHKSTSFSVKCRMLNRLSGLQRSKGLLTELKSIHFLFRAAITSLSAILKVGERIY